MGNLSKKLKGETSALLLAVVIFLIMKYVLMNIFINIKNEVSIFNGIEINNIAFAMILIMITLIIYKAINPSAIKIKSSLKRTWLLIGITFVQIVLIVSGLILITIGIISKITEGSDIYSALAVSLPEYLAVIYYAFFIAEMKLIYSSCEIITDTDGKAKKMDTFNTTFIATTICLFLDVFIVLLLYKLYPLRSENTFINWLHSLYNYRANDHQFYNTFYHKNFSISLVMETLKLMFNIKIFIPCVFPLSFILVRPFISSVNDLKKLIASSLNELKNIISEVKPGTSVPKVLKGYDSFAEESVEVYKLVPAHRVELANEDDDFVKNPYDIIKKTCEVNGINSSFLIYDKKCSILKSTATPKLKSGKQITSYFISSKTGTFIPINNAKLPIKSNDVRIVTFIGSKNSAKSCTMQALAANYTSEAPRLSIEMEYYQQLLRQNKVPEATEETLLKSPGLFLNYNNHLLSCFDVAGENSSLTALTASAKKRVIVLMIDIESEKSLDDALQYIKDIKQSKTNPKKIIICITKCDLITEADRLMNYNNPSKRTKAIIDNYSSRNNKFKVLVENAGLSEFSPCPVEVMFIASTGCAVDSNYNLLGDYNPRYIDVLLERIIN